MRAEIVYTRVMERVPNVAYGRQLRYIRDKKIFGEMR